MNYIFKITKNLKDKNIYNKMTSINYLTLFNDHFTEFVDDILYVFPDNVDILTAKNAFEMIRKANPKIIIKVFYTYVIQKYSNFIDEGNINFFVEKDYTNDLTKLNSPDKINESIDRLRNPVKMMCQEDREKVMKYIKNLKKISELYFLENPI